MYVLILNGPAKGNVVDVETRTMIGPAGRVKMFQSPGEKGILTYRVGTIEHNDRKFSVASAVRDKSLEEAFDIALKNSTVGPEQIEEAVRKAVVD